MFDFDTNMNKPKVRTKIKQLNKITSKNNRTLLQELKFKHIAQFNILETFFNSQQKNLNHQSQIYTIISSIFCEWAQIQLTEQRLKYLSLQRFENSIKQVSQDQIQLSKLISYDFSVKCQISGSIPKHPARTSQCRFLCVVQREILLQSGVCSCGRYLQKYENQLVQDWVINFIINFQEFLSSKSKYQEIHENILTQNQPISKYQKNLGHKKWNGNIRIHLDKNQFEFIYDSTYYELI